MTINFEIEHIDPLGQGVSKLGEKITFIPKVLPGEKGSCQVYAQKSKVQFAQLEELTVTSKQRVTPTCSHYHNCPSCHYLHTDYINEVLFKESTLKRQLAKSHLSKSEDHALLTHQASRRNAYRNRMQLHYDKKKKKLGQFNRALKEIVEIPHCQLPNNNVKEKIFELYQGKSWLKLVENAPVKGHIEIYEHESKMLVHVNQEYAAEGFTQVNHQMNQKALKLIQKQFEANFKDKQNVQVLDIFGGRGNLSKNFQHCHSIVVDQTAYAEDIFASHQKYLQFNLYQKQSLPKFKKIFTQPFVDLVILDPPRSGFKELAQWLDYFKPPFLYYMSCQSDTALRDLAKCQDYHLQQVHLLDFFPSTYHFETIFFLQRHHK